jgi:hypothetical protein
LAPSIHSISPHASEACGLGPFRAAVPRRGLQQPLSRPPLVERLTLDVPAGDAFALVPGRHHDRVEVAPTTCRRGDEPGAERMGAVVAVYEPERK